MRHSRKKLLQPLLEFQSTHPLRGATQSLGVQMNRYNISIHAPLAGCDFIRVHLLRRLRLFQSTHPLRGATRQRTAHKKSISISIHAPLAGCDENGKDARYANFDFTPPPAGGVPPPPPRILSFRFFFQPPPPLGGATPHFGLRYHTVDISIHAPLAGCDRAE